MAAYLYSHRLVWSHREGATLKVSNITTILITEGSHWDPWIRHQSTKATGSEDAVSPHNALLLTH